MKKRFMVVLLLLATIISMFPMVSVRPKKAEAADTIYIEGLGNLRILHQGGDGYTISLSDGKDLIISGNYFSNSDALVSYHTERLFFTKERTGGNPTDFQYYEHNVHDHEIRYGQNRSYDTYTVPREVLVEMLLELFGEEGLKTKQKVRMSEGYIIKERDTADSEWEYLYDEEYSSLTGIQKARDWSNTTKLNFANYYDIEIELELIPYNITVTAGDGGSVGQDCPEAYAGDDVTINAYPDDGYSFAGWTVVSGNIGSFNKSSAETTFTMPSCDVELRANFKEKYVPITEPPLPDTYTLTIEAGEGGTASVVSGKKKYYYGDEEVTVKATPNQGCAFMEWAVSVESGETLDGFDISAATNSFVMPESNVTLTALFVTPPDEDVDYEERFIRYYTTDKGYSMSRIYNGDTALKPDNDYAFGYIADGSSSVGWREIGETTPTKLTEYYETGTDAAGNKWYFIPGGSNATYVHPRVYNNYDVSTGEIQYITELVFPETITYGGSTYTVISIGGGMGKYRDESDDDTRTQPSYGFNITDGRYQYNEKYTSGIGTETYTENIRIYFGVLGNGSVTSKGSYQLRYTNGVHEYYDYQNDYHVYNTTLKNVTIPDTVITIEDYAFYNCQALETVTGGAGVKNIRAYAFEGAGHLTPSLSTLRVDGYENPVKQRYYYYNKAYAFGGFTATMSEWQRSVRLSSHLALPGEGTTTPAFPSLQYIETYAFRRRSNLGSVSLPVGVVSIGEGAFASCALDTITVPGMNTVIKEGNSGYGHTTLGTKGTDVEKKTVIITEPNSKAMDYGIAYHPYYDLRAGYTVTYHNNTTPPDTYITKADVSLIKEAIVEKAEIYSYTGYVSGGVSYSARNTLYLDDGGKLWMRESTAKTLPNLLFGGTAFRSLELIEGTSSSYSSSGGSSDSVTSVYAIAFAENGAVYGIAPDGTCTSLVPAGSTGHLWGNMTLFSNESNASPYGSGGGYGYFTTYYLYYLYNGVVYRKSVYESSSSSYSSSSGSSSGYGFYTVFGTAAQKISLNGADVTSFFVYSTSLNKKEESVYNGQQSSSAHRGYTYSLPKAFLMTSDGRCMTGGYDVDEYYNTSSYGNQEGTSAGYDDAVFTNGPEKISYAWTTMADSNRFRQIVASSNGEVGSTQCTYSTPGGMQVHPSSYDNINVIDGNGNLIYIRDINQSASGYLGCGTAVTVCAGKNFVSAEITDGDILLTDASGNTWKYVESTGAVTAYDNSASETTPVELLVVGYEFVTTLYDCMFDAAGREFLGWTLRADGTGTLYQPGDELAIKAATTVYAKWDMAKKKIVYIANGGVGRMEDDEYPVDTPNPVTLRKNIPPKEGYERNGYEFAGWSYKANPGASDIIFADGGQISIAPGITKLYAQWTPITYTVMVGTEDMRITEQEFDEHILGLDDTLFLWMKEDKILNVVYHLNDKDTQPSMSANAAFVTELTERNTKAVLQFYGWRLYEDVNRDRKIDDTDRYVGYYRAGDILKNLATKKNAVFYVFPNWGGSASYVLLPEIECDGYVFVGYTPGMAYRPDWFETQETYNQAIREDVLVPAPKGSGARYQPKSDGEVLYAYYERKEQAGKLYGFEVYDVFGAPAWEEIIGTENRYTVGVQEESGSWNTLPLRTGVHPVYRNLGGLPIGGGFSFHVVSTGKFARENVTLTILPYLCPVGENGYYAGDLYFEQETDKGNYLKKWQPEEQAVILHSDKDSTVATDGFSRLWTGNFQLPKNLWVAESGTNVVEYQQQFGLSFEEPFWIKDVRLMLRFTLCLKSGDGECLYYGMTQEESEENVWVQEAGETYREDYDKNRYKIYGGEVAVIYPGDCADRWNSIHGIY